MASYSNIGWLKLIIEQQCNNSCPPVASNGSSLGGTRQLIFKHHLLAKRCPLRAAFQLSTARGPGGTDNLSKPPHPLAITVNARPPYYVLSLRTLWRSHFEPSHPEHQGLTNTPTLLACHNHALQINVKGMKTGT